MTDLLELYNLAEEHGTQVYWFDLETAESLSMPLPDGTCAIALNPWRMHTVAGEKVKLAHELGHCEAGAFYNRWAALDLRQKHEYRATKWAIKKILPEEDLYRAYREGYREPWEMAEYLDLPEEFVRQALEFYGNQV